MKQKSPHLCGRVFFALALLFISLQAFTQTGSINSSVTITVTVGGFPTDFSEGVCGFGTSTFGAYPVMDVCGPAAWARDMVGQDSILCDSVAAGSLTGKVALVRRGGCASPNTASGNFVVKARKAQQAGATAVLVANNSGTANQDDCFVMGMTGADPNVTVPTFFICRSMASFIDDAINSGQPVEICIHPPNVYIDSIYYPVQNLQTPVSQIGTDTFGFFAFLTNTRGIDLTNVALKAAVKNAAGDELYSTTLNIPLLAGSVSDSAFVLPGVFAPELPIGDYSIEYSTSSDPIAGGIYRDKDSDVFHVTENLFAKDDAANIGLQPAPVPDNGWGIGNVYVMSTGTLDHFKVSTAQVRNTGSTEWPANRMNGELFLFRVRDEVASDYANFEDAGFLTPSFEIKGTGSFVAPTDATPYQVHNVSLIDLETAEVGVPVENGSHYVLAIYYADSSRYGFNAFQQGIEVAGPQGLGTILFADEWFLGGFAGHPSAVLRMFIDLVTTTDEKPLPDSYLKVFPNPVREVLNLGLNLEKPSDVTITLAEINGRTIQIEDKKGVTSETFTYQLPQLSAGTYLARIATKEGTLTKKFIVQK
ncbi:MAG: T9SS type A sorting domain-containing protein [Saprospiraceae bacterium]|nr:T9SS type A sorting domain-containing protein [Saprospiraceae bacterium]